MTGFTVDISQIATDEGLRTTLQELSAGIAFTVQAGRVNWTPADERQRERVATLQGAGLGEYFDACCRGLPDGVYTPTTAPDASTVRATGNPWAPGSFNLTRQIEMRRENPQMAALFQQHDHRQAEAQRNPFARGAGFNLTEQIRIKRENPGLAAELKAKAESA
jgi:hypothetical protein